VIGLLAKRRAFAAAAYTAVQGSSSVILKVKGSNRGDDACDQDCRGRVVSMGPRAGVNARRAERLQSGRQIVWPL
jgi:hypothetical protein